MGTKGERLLTGSKPEDAKERKQKPRALLGLVCVALVLAYGLHNVGVISWKSAAVEPPTIKIVTAPLPDLAGHVHPILSLLHYGRQRYVKTINRQSRTLQKASAVYKVKYGRPVPKGFAEWFAFAAARNHTLIDEYDSLMADVAKFRILSPKELAQRTRTLGSLPGVSIVSIRNGKSEVHSRSGRWAPALAFQEMLAPFVRNLPDMDVAINEKLEGRVLPELTRQVRLEEWLDDDRPADNTSDPLAGMKTFPQSWSVDGSEFGSTWESFRRACPPDSAARRLHESLQSVQADNELRQQKRADIDLAFREGLSLIEINNYTVKATRRKSEGLEGNRLPPRNEMTFMTGTDAEQHICDHPAMHSMHSAFYTNTRAIPHLYPLFSPSKPNGFADLLIPSHHYWSPSSEYTYDWELKQGRSKTSADIDWSAKDDLVYWRGKVTRGADTPYGHETHYQKQRLVTFANEDSRWALDRSALFGQGEDVEATDGLSKTLLSLDPTTSTITAATLSLGPLNDHSLDVALACDVKLGECQNIMREGYRIDQPKALSHSWKHKYVLDVDEIGLSAKFMALMESKCAVVKSTIHREFWTDWLVPWYHFIPLSSSYLELHNIQAFFSGLPALPKSAKTPGANGDSDWMEADSNANNTPLPNDVFKQARNQQEERAEYQRQQNGPSKYISGMPITPARGPVSPINPLAPEGSQFSGDKALQDIGLAGSRWKRRHVRRSDMQVYVYRLMIEWAALLDGDREM